MAVFFHTIEHSFSIKGKRILKNWIQNEIKLHSKICGDINIIFCSDDYLLEINKKYLTHNFYTDIITFNYNSANDISGDLYISVDRILDNAKNFEVAFDTELRRVMIHGILHLLGNNDDSPLLKEKIHNLEDQALRRFPI